jgi:S1-C subfamily serine protease
LGSAGPGSGGPPAGPAGAASSPKTALRLSESGAARVDRNQGPRQGSAVGSGFVISPDGYVVTNNHVIEGATEVKVHLGDRDYKAEIKGTDRETDLALLRVQSSECFPAEFGQPPWLGAPIWVVAYPWGRNMTLAGGIVSQVNGDQPSDRDTAPRLIVDASVSYGASGGGVYDEQTGRLLGLVEGYRTARVSFSGDAQYIDVPVPGETYVVPLAAIRRFLMQADREDLLGTLSTIANTRR